MLKRAMILKKQNTFPEENGDYQLIAAIIYKGELIKSIRDFAIN